MKVIVSTLLASAAVLAGCASGPPPARDFPPGARVPSVAELTTLFRGKTTTTESSTAGTIRVDYAADSNQLKILTRGRADTGTWRADENGKVCFEFKTFQSTCNDIRMVGQEVYIRRANGEVTSVMISR
ncbi:MAG: DUF995 domain-containing protein [Burkholderiaceae bacterium]